ncbi:MAG: bifunctional folylpolyglutamate synthase/dihydrofolate synthase [bacterium]|nr:bifunctional folylpolyglutamate synthase/dihydrofolate synthase [bacterium]MCM1374139.1 bifunctional folylpolyglutamate synthase/dihydrofolate synthase [Muribaculum sp.]
MRYQEALNYIDSIKQYGIVPGLDSVRELCHRLGNPQDGLRFVHIAGTNGKGSVLAYVSTALRCAGYKVGRYISPTIRDYRERFQINGRMITQKDLCELMEELRQVCDGMVAEGFAHPTPFEVETALGFLYFARRQCELVVLETGMGGRLDATNVIQGTLVAALTSISMDHMQYLGKSLREIAGEKAGIIKSGCRVVSVSQCPEVVEVIREQADRLHCPLVLADESAAKRVRYGLERQRFDYDGMRDLEIHLAGRCQIGNAVLAIEVCRALSECGYDIPEKALRQGLGETCWLGRFSILEKKPLFVADGAHNEDAARELAQSIELYFANKRIIFIMGVLKDKEYEKIIGLTARYADQILTVTPPDNPRAMGSYELAQEVARVHPQVTAVDSLEEAVEISHLLAGREDVILAFGSLSFLGRLMEIMETRRQKSKVN